MINNYLKIAWRSLWKHRKTTLINIAGLTIGMAAAVLITLWVQNELSFDRYHKDAAQIYTIGANIAITKQETWKWEDSPYILGETAKKQLPEIADLTRVQYSENTLHYNGEDNAEKNIGYVDDRWFEFFHYDIKEGSIRAFLQDRQGMLMTESMAKKYFGTGDPIGKVIRIDTINYQVRAVAKDNPANSSFQLNALMQIASQMSDAHYKKEASQWGNYSFQTFVKFTPAANIKAIPKKLDRFLLKNEPKSNASFELVKLKDIHFQNDLMNTSIEHGNIKTVEIFALLALLIVVTACINYVNLTTARASIRAKEVSVRKIVGAGRVQLFYQFMAESLVISALSLLLAVLLIEVCLPVFNTIADKHFTQPLASFTTWYILGGTLLVSFVLTGVYPAVLLSSFKPMSVFRGKSVLSFKDTSLRKVLVTLQFVISVILITGTMVIYRQLNYLQKVDLGFDRSHIFTFQVSYWRIPGFDYKNAGTLFSTIRQQLDQRSEFEQVSQANQAVVNFDTYTSGSADWRGRPKDFKPSIAPLTADTSLLRMLQLKMMSGHWFTNADKHNVILNETAVKQLCIQKPVLGQVFYFRGDTGIIVGVVKDFHFKSLHDKISPMVINYDPTSMMTFYLKTKPGHDAEAIVAAQKIYKQFVPGQPFSFSFLDDKYNKLYLKEQKLSTLITFFATIAILISSLGLLGLAAFAAEQRIKEIGIRKVLGASVQHIVGLLSADFVKIVIIASMIAFPIAWWAMSKWLQDFAYKVDISWWIFVLAGVSALIVALVTVSIEAIRSAMTNPVKSLRSE